MDWRRGSSFSSKADPSWLLALRPAYLAPGLKIKAAPQPQRTRPGPTSPLTKVQQLLHGQRGRAVAREMLNLAGDQTGAAQRAGAAHQDAGHLHLDAHQACQGLGLT